ANGLLVISKLGEASASVDRVVESPRVFGIPREHGRSKPIRARAQPDRDVVADQVRTWRSLDTDAVAVTSQKEISVDSVPVILPVEPYSRAGTADDGVVPDDGGGQLEHLDRTCFPADRESSPI